MGTTGWPVLTRERVGGSVFRMEIPGPETVSSGIWFVALGLDVLRTDFLAELCVLVLQGLLENVILILQIMYAGLKFTSNHVSELIYHAAILCLGTVIVQIVPSTRFGRRR